MPDRNKLTGCCETVISVMAQHIDHLETMIQISYDDRTRLEKELAEAERKNLQLISLLRTIKELTGANTDETFEKLVSSVKIVNDNPLDPFDEGTAE